MDGVRSKLVVVLGQTAKTGGVPMAPGFAEGGESLSYTLTP